MTRIYFAEVQDDRLTDAAYLLLVDQCRRDLSCPTLMRCLYDEDRMLSVRRDDWCKIDAIIQYFVDHGVTVRLLDGSRVVLSGTMQYTSETIQRAQLAALRKTIDSVITPVLASGHLIKDIAAMVGCESTRATLQATPQAVQATQTMQAAPTMPVPTTTTVTTVHHKRRSTVTRTAPVPKRQSVTASAVQKTPAPTQSVPSAPSAPSADVVMSSVSDLLTQQGLVSLRSRTALVSLRAQLSMDYWTIPEAHALFADPDVQRLVQLFREYIFEPLELVSAVEPPRTWSSVPTGLLDRLGNYECGWPVAEMCELRRIYV
jgi:hypothetical protein